MKKSPALARRRRGSFLQHHSLSLVSLGILGTWLAFYVQLGPSTHAGAFFGSAVADWTGVVVTVIATKYFYERGSAESRKPKGHLRNHVLEVVRDHSLTIVLVITGLCWVAVYVSEDFQGKWGQVWSGMVSEWTQLLGLVLMTKRLFEDRSKESRRQ